MALEYFCCFHSYREKTESLSDHDFTVLFRGLMKYSETGEIPKLDGQAKIAFDFISSDIRSTKAKYQHKCEQNRLNRVNHRSLSNVVDGYQSLSFGEQSKYKTESESKNKKDFYNNPSGQRKNKESTVDDYSVEGWD